MPDIKLMKIKTKLTVNETKQLVRLLGKVRLPAPYPIFVALLKSVPIIAIDLAVMPDDNHILLTYREDDFYKGWHVPGSILCFHDSIIAAWKRVAIQELGMKIIKAEFLTYFNYKDNRETGVTLLFVAKPKGKTKKGTYFSLNNIPKDFVREQLPEINFLKQRFGKN